MKRLLLFLLLAMPVLLFAQYPPSGNKQRLGWQTTGDGLVYRDAGPPSYTPNSRNNAYIYLDTIARRYYHFSSGAWRYLSAEKYIRLQDVTVGAAAVADSLITYDRLFFAADLTSGASSDKAVQLPIAGLDSTYAGRVVRLSVIDSSATYDYAITSSSPDALLVGDTLATSYSVENGETAEFQLYVFDTIYQWRLIHTSRADSLILPDSLAYGTGTTNYLSRWIAPFTLGTAGISDDGSEIQFARPTVLYGVNTAAPATYGTFGIDNTLGIERPTYYNGSAWVPWLAYSGGTNQYSYFSNSNTITSGTQLYRDANGVSIGDGNYFRLPSNSTVGSKLLSEAQTEYDNTFDQPFYRDAVGRRPIGEWFRSGTTGIYTVHDVEIRGQSTNGNFAVKSASSNGYWSFSAINATGNFTLFDANSSTTPLEIQKAAPNNSLYINSSGNIGLGTSSITSGYRLDARGNARFAPTSGGAVVDVVLPNGTSSGGLGLVLYEGSTVIGSLESYGNSFSVVNYRRATILRNYFGGDFLNVNFSGGTNRIRYRQKPDGKTIFSTKDYAAASFPSPSYDFEIDAVGAMTLPRGTTAQRPTIVASTAPIRFNSDSTAYEGGYGVGDWRLFADRTWVNTQIGATRTKAYIITRTIYDGDAALPDSTVTVNGTFNAGFWRVPESMDGYTLTKASFGIFDKGDMIATGATYSFGVQKCNGSNMSCSNSSNVNFTPSSETELELSLSITLNANDIIRVNYQPPQGCAGGCGTQNVNGLVVTYTIQQN